MALSSLNIEAQSKFILKNKKNVYWTIPEIARWINAGCRELVLLKPTALTANVAMLLKVGTKQSLIGAGFKKTVDGTPANISASQLLEVSRNLGATGTEADAGGAITGMDRKVLDVMLPGWHTQSGTGEVKHFCFDPKDPKTFYTYPKATASPVMYVEVVVSRNPANALLDTAVALGSDDIDSELDDIYENALVDYVLYRAFGKDAEVGSAQQSQWHYNAFRTSLGAKAMNEVRQSPDRKYVPRKDQAAQA